VLQIIRFALTCEKVKEKRTAWLDYDSDTLTVSRSVWRKHVSLPKTVHSRAAVPVIKPLRDLMDGM